MMKSKMFICAIAATLVMAVPASAACFVDYKAKKSPPLRLHYGVVQVPARFCGHRKKIRKNVAKRIRRGGWTLLNVMSQFGPEGLIQRQQSAGRFYLKF